MEEDSGLHWKHVANTRFIYYQGMSSSQIQAAKYVGHEGFVATTGERVSFHKPINVMRNPLIAEEIHDVNLNPLHTFWDHINPVNLFMVMISFAVNYRNFSFQPADYR